MRSHVAEFAANAEIPKRVGVACIAFGHANPTTRNHIPRESSLPTDHRIIHG